MTKTVGDLAEVDDARLYAMLVPVAAGDREIDGVTRGAASRGLSAIGKAVFRRWSRTLHEFVCTPSKDDITTRKEVLTLVSGGKDATAVATLAAFLAVTFALSAPVASVISVLAFRLIFVPAGEGLCDYWTSTLEDTPAKRKAKAKAPAKKAARGTKAPA